ncbi:MAG: hypothetical protein K6C32_03850 [Bacilli bacterium]|nr:hypothetical protein [Bacilli bacterium]
MKQLEHLNTQFNKQFNEESDQLFSCGGRFEILGNHTDHNHGLCLASACNLEITASVKKTNELKVYFASKGFDLDEVDLSDLKATNKEYATSKGLIRGVAAYLKSHGYIIGGFKAYSESTIFKGAGVSSSAAFELLVGYIFNVLYNDGKISKFELCKAGKYAENEYFGKKSGLLDQIGVGYGGVVKIDFKNIDDPLVEQIEFPFKDLHFVLVNTGGDHSNLSDLYSSIPLDMYSAAKKCGHQFLIEGNLEELDSHKDELSESEYLRGLHFYLENERVKTAFRAIREKDEELFLKQINESRLSSTKYLKNMMVENHYEGSPLEACDLLLKATENHGAVKINGGGFAGSVIALVPSKYLSKTMEKMRQKYGNENVVEIFVRENGPLEPTSGMDPDLRVEYAKGEKDN